MVRAAATATSAAMCPTRMAVRRTGVSSSRSKYLSCTSSTRAGARDTPVTPRRMAVATSNEV